MEGKSSIPGRLWALGYDLLMEGMIETLYLGPHRRKLIAPVRGLVLEVGAGTGISLRYYSPAATVVATDVDPASLTRLKGKARQVCTRVLVAAADAARLPFPDYTFDALVCNLALCTIPDPHRALAEIRRVLRPGAPAHFLEHVRAESPIRARLQDLLAPLWAKLAGGCRLNQDTERLIRKAGLTVHRVETRDGMLLPMKLIWASNSGDTQTVLK